jgi:hypothetical protein
VFCAISLIEAPTSSAPAATVAMLLDTFSAAELTTVARPAVSSALAAICALVTESCSDADASVLALSAIAVTAARIDSVQLFTAVAIAPSSSLGPCGAR